MTPGWLVAVALGAALALTACTGSGDDSGGDSGPEAGSTSGDGASGGTTPGGPAPYLPVPQGVVLTDPGSELGVGETATVAWRLRKDEVGVLNIKVRKLVHADIAALNDWHLDPAGRGSSLYYVTVTVANVGDEDLGGVPVPLYVLDDANTLVGASTFRTEFEPCASPAMPEEFVTGDKATMCLAYLVPKRGDLQAVAFRPTEKFNPITWVGKVSEPKPPKPTKKPTPAG